MAEVRNFGDYRKRKDNIDAPEKEDAGASFSREPSYREKIRTHRIAVFFRTAVLAIAVVGITAAIYVNWRDKVYSEARLLGQTQMTGMEGVSILPLGKNILKYSKDGISCMSPDGTARWNMTYGMQTPEVRTCGDTVAVGDYNGNTIYVANSAGKLGNIGTNLPIRDFCVSSQGVVAAILDDGDVTRINLYDTAGKELATVKATMANSGYPMALSISPNGELLAVSYLGEEDGEIQTSVTFFNFGNVGQNKTDNMVSSFKYPGKVIPMDVFMNGDTNFAVADDGIIFFKGSDVPNDPIINSIEDGEILSVYYSEDYVGLVCTGSTDEGIYSLKVYNTSGREILTKDFNMAYTNIVFSDDQFIIYNDTEWKLFGLDGNERFEGASDKAVISIIPGATRSKFTIVTYQSLEQIELR